MSLQQKEIHLQDLVKMVQMSSSPLVVEVLNTDGKEEGVVTGDVLELVKVEMKNYSLNAIENQYEKSEEGAMLVPMSRNQRFYVANKFKMDHCFESVQDIINAMPAVSSYLYSPDEIRFNDVYIREKERLKLLQKIDSTGISQLKLRAVKQDIEFTLPANFHLRIYQYPITTSAFSKDNSEGHLPQYILANWKIGDEPFVVMPVDFGIKSNCPSSEPGLFSDNHPWARQKLSMKPYFHIVAKHTISGKELHIEESANMEVRLALDNSLQEKSLEEVAKEMVHGKSKCFVITKGEQITALQPLTWIRKGTSMVIHCVQNTPKVWLINEDKHHYLVKDTYKGLFKRRLPQYNTMGDLYNAWNKEKWKDTMFRINTTDIRSGPPLTNCKAGDVIMIVGKTTTLVNNKQVEVIQCIRETQTDICSDVPVLYSIESVGNFEPTERTESVIETNYSIKDLGKRPEAKYEISKTDRTLAYDPLRLCNSLKFVKNVEEKSLICSLVHLNGLVTHTKPIEISTCRENFMMKEHSRDLDTCFLDWKTVKYLPVVDRVTEEIVVKLGEKKVKQKPPYTPWRPPKSRPVSSIGPDTICTKPPFPPTLRHTQSDINHHNLPFPIPNDATSPPIPEKFFNTPCSQFSSTPNISFNKNAPPKSPKNEFNLSSSRKVPLLPSRPANLLNHSFANSNADISRTGVRRENRNNGNTQNKNRSHSEASLLTEAQIQALKQEKAAYTKPSNPIPGNRLFRSSFNEEEDRIPLRPPRLPGLRKATSELNVSKITSSEENFLSTSGIQSKMEIISNNNKQPPLPPRKSLPDVPSDSRMRKNSSDGFLSSRNTKEHFLPRYLSQQNFTVQNPQRFSSINQLITELKEKVFLTEDGEEFTEPRSETVEVIRKPFTNSRPY